MQLGDVSSILMGQAPPGEDCNLEQNGVPFVKVGNFGNSEPRIEEWTTNPKRMANKSDVLICVVGATCGKLNFGIECAIGRSVAAIRPESGKLNRNYLFHYLKKWVLRLREKSQGSAQGVITKKMLEIIPIPNHTIQEQIRIAAILDKADEITKNTQESEELRKIFTHSLFIDIFGDPRINPMNWKEERIENLCERIFAGGDVPKDSLSEEYTSVFNIPIFSNGKAEKALYGFTSIPKVDKDSVTVAGRGIGIGYSVVRKAPFYPIIRLIVATPNTEKVNLQYLCSAISYLEFGKGGSAIPQLTVPMLKSRTVLVPPIELQEKFSLILELMRNIPISTNLTENNSLSITQELLT